MKKGDRRFDRLSQQMAESFLALREELRQTNLRLDQIIVNTGAHWRDLDRLREHARAT